MDIYPFNPTYLYIKRHSVTGKLYFGMTTQDPTKYQGSGLHWLKHIKKHGIEHVETLWYCLFLDQESISNFALNFSKQHNIVESEDWLNLMYETGIHSHGTIGWIPSDETKKKQSEANTGLIRTQKHRNALSRSKTGKHQRHVTCPHCRKSGGMNAMNRYHFNNCKSFVAD